VIVLLLLIAATTSTLILLPAGPTTETFVVIPPHTSAPRIATLLARQGIIESRYAFLVYRLLHRGTLKAGEYRFDHPAPLPQVYARIQRGDVYTLTVTVPEGFNLFDIAQAVEAAKLKPAAEFLAGTRANVDLISDLDPNATSLEGYLFPDTYRFPPAISVRDIQAAMVRNFRLRTQPLALGSNTHAMVTLASLIEKETGAANERPLVSSVFTNRLARGMPLATDPSVIYGLLLQGRYRGTIYASDLSTDTPYNTYLHAGLPPGPICSPGMASLQAALRPPATDFLYFVSDNQGHSRFAATLDQHNRNVADYRRRVRLQSVGR